MKNWKKLLKLQIRNKLTEDKSNNRKPPEMEVFC